MLKVGKEIIGLSVASGAALNCYYEHMGMDHHNTLAIEPLSFFTLILITAFSLSFLFPLGLLV